MAVPINIDEYKARQALMGRCPSLLTGRSSTDFRQLASRTRLPLEADLTTIDLIDKSMLGHWDVTPEVSQCEYQFGRRLIYVQHPKGEPWQSYIEAAQRHVESAWLDIDGAVKFAEQLSRPLIPQFWEAHDRSGRPGARFDVYSICFNIPDRRPTFHVGVNHDFEYSWTRYEEFDLWQDSPIVERLPEPPARFFITVRRLGPGLFESVA